MKNQKLQAIRPGEKPIRLHPREFALILALRKYPYGEVVVIMHDGIPQRLKKVEFFEKLDVDNSVIA